MIGAYRCSTCGRLSYHLTPSVCGCRGGYDREYVTWATLRADDPRAAELDDLARKAAGVSPAWVFTAAVFGLCVGVILAAVKWGKLQW